MKTQRGFLIVTIVPFVLALSLSCEPASKSITQIGENTAGRQVVNFNHDWKFAKGGQKGAEAVDFNDSSWKAVRLPHDWAIAGPFNPKEDGYAGKLPWWGQGWYRKTFKLDRAEAGKRVYFDFDGVMAFPKVYVNGQLAGEWDYGYMSFRVDATPYVKFGADNTIAVYADTRKHGTRCATAQRGSGGRVRGRGKQREYRDGRTDCVLPRSPARPECGTGRDATPCHISQQCQSFSIPVRHLDLAS